MQLHVTKQAYGRTFRVVDSHTMGEPTRIIYDGFPPLEGETMMARKTFLERNYDHYRKALIWSPAGIGTCSARF